jgi:hypothetical protein
MHPEDLPFRVIRVNSEGEVIARANNLLAVRLYPKDTIQYRDGARIIARSEPKGVIALAWGCHGSGVEGVAIIPLWPRHPQQTGRGFFLPTRSWTTPHLSPLPDSRQPQKALALGCSLMSL